MHDTGHLAFESILTGMTHLPDLLVIKSSWRKTDNALSLTSSSSFLTICFEPPYMFPQFRDEGRGRVKDVALAVNRLYEDREYMRNPVRPAVICRREGTSSLPLICLEIPREMSRTGISPASSWESRTAPSGLAFAMMGEMSGKCDN